ncbi:NAD kinase [Companilactobacillus sp.]|jgi:NAD+ kinase|uniref:NAD kinase n=1 Tax=Companilactobacillus sp. TaxID=2767905 RepID=UPI0025C6AA55|nr:NAD kinase [Companilactobacillus sp.]MCH4008832.1 NAD kinase [Companilactobacillus sp.]MCH4050989.1 NAD kinase [Companilactobacillus sp.]MCH4076775.1 NAD kinase [Companilactobacillus sp.]MCH4125350.1 NAD kinase [Companilactobacillus sp.]MCH4131891.1 NAD kinase [Companilactobacillus sp.]
MKFWVNNNGKQESVEAADTIRRELIEHDFELDQNSPALVISVGGDGTLISTFHSYINQLDKVKFVALHTGHLGFYSDWTDDEIEELIQRIVEHGSDIPSTTYPLVEVDIEAKDGSTQHGIAINEATVRRLSALTLKTRVDIDSEYFESFRGDGLCFATPTGSTAYSKGIGGALIHPKVNVFQMVEMASINNRVYRTISSPLIIPENQVVHLYPQDAEDYVINFDGTVVELKNTECIKIQLSKQRAQFAQYRHRHFWTRVETAFLGQNDE